MYFTISNKPKTLSVKCKFAETESQKVMLVFCFHSTILGHVQRTRTQGKMLFINHLCLTFVRKHAAYLNFADLFREFYRCGINNFSFDDFQNSKKNVVASPSCSFILWQFPIPRIAMAERSVYQYCCQKCSIYNRTGSDVVLYLQTVNTKLAAVGARIWLPDTERFFMDLSGLIEASGA